jgi:hypothetical protein
MNTRSKFFPPCGFRQIDGIRAEMAVQALADVGLGADHVEQFIR